MKKKTKIMSISGVLLLMGLGGGYFILDEKEPAKPKEVEVVIDSKMLPSDLNPEDKSVRAKVVASVYKNLKEYQYVGENKKLKTPKVDKELEKEIHLETHPYPVVNNGEVEPEMTKILQSLLSRKDGSTNVVDDKSIQVVEKSVFKEWKKSFNSWSKGGLTTEELVKRWNTEQKKSSYSGLSKPTVLTYTFPYSQSVVKMMDAVLEEVEEKGASTAPHISFVSVTFDENSSAYTLYFAESHIE